MLKLTPRDKAILVGIHMNGGTIDDPPDASCLSYYITSEWIKTTIKDIKNRVSSKEIGEFEDKLKTVFFTNDDEPRYPEEYIDKLSPLAIAIWRATNTEDYAIRSWSQEDRKNFVEKFNTKWSIGLQSKDLYPKSENDEINLWILTKRYIQEFAPNMTPNFVAKYPRNGKMIYLSGGQQFAINGGASWRSLVSPALYRAGYDIFNPVFEGQVVLDTYGVNFDQLTLDEYIGAGSMFIEKDLEAIKSSDAVLTLINESAMKGAGTKSEATIAVDYNIPNFFVLENDFQARKLPIWLAGCIRDKKFLFEHNDFVGAVQAIKRTV